MSKFPVPNGHVECTACKGTGNVRSKSFQLHSCERCDGYGYYELPKALDGAVATANRLAER